MLGKKGLTGKRVEREVKKITIVFNNSSGIVSNKIEGHSIGLEPVVLSP